MPPNLKVYNGFTENHTPSPNPGSPEPSEHVLRCKRRARELARLRRRHDDPAPPAVRAKRLLILCMVVAAIVGAVNALWL